MRVLKFASMVFFCVLITQSIQAQSISDGLRMSQSYPGGTARFVAMGGAFSSVGGEFSSTNSNPATVGVYQSWDFSVTPSFSNSQIRSTYNGQKATDSRNKLALDNLSFVLSVATHGHEGNIHLNQVNLGFGYVRTNHFYTNSLIQGLNDQNSIMDYFAFRANGLDYKDLCYDYDEKGNLKFDPFNEGSAPWDLILAFNGYLIDTAAGSPTSYLAMLANGDAVVQRQEIATAGNTGEYAMSLGIDISDKVYLGIGMGIVRHEFEQSIVYSEDADKNNGTTSNGFKFNYLDYLQNYKTTSKGYNAKIGAIYTPIESLRFGLAVHTPTFFKVDYNYAYHLTSQVQLADSLPARVIANKINGSYDYSVESPFKFIGGISYILANTALFSVDVEYLDYNSLKFREGGDGDNLSDMNLEVSNTYKNVTNVRAGTEILLGPLAFRLGYAFYMSPYRANLLNHNLHTHIISGGVGYSGETFYIDAAYQHFLAQEKYRFYDLPETDIFTPEITANQSNGKFLLTFGFRF